MTEHLLTVDRGWPGKGNQKCICPFQWQLNSHLPRIQSELPLIDICGSSTGVKNVNTAFRGAGAARQRLRWGRSNHQGSLSADYRPFRRAWREASCLWARRALFLCSAKLIRRQSGRDPVDPHPPPPHPPPLQQVGLLALASRRQSNLQDDL